LYFWIFADRPVCNSGGLREESKTKKRIARAYGFCVCHRFVRATLGPGDCRGPTCKESMGDGAKDTSRLLLHRRGLRRYYFHSSDWEPGEKLRAWCSSVLRENNFSGVMKYKTSSYLRSSACGRPACWPGRLRDWEQDRRSGSRSAGSEAIVMRAGPAGRLARAAGSGECAPQNVPRAPPERTQQARRRPPEHFRCVESVEKH
jgi:hypothetical protein